jgi:pilus assembly protein Flp/PilA
MSCLPRKGLDGFRGAALAKGIPVNVLRRGHAAVELRDWLELARIELRREEGQTMTEYGVLLALIAVVVIAALLVLGPKIKNIFTYIGSQL